MICAICRRDARGFGFEPRLIGVPAPAVKLCSRTCQNITTRLKGMINPNIHERSALLDASAAGGTYVESLGRTDLATWTPEEWATLIDVVITRFQDSLRTAYAEDPPF
ncbi:hypothetical protein EWI61_14560 [Methylolobus aquaticus]|nr:hypothetical protein EWI61_14560 [Methylolobus aquaticus]